MAFTQADLDALDAAIVAGRGARSITFSDQTVVFNSIREMLELRAVMQNEIAGTAGTPRNYRLGATSKGC
jgi:hypothetical protein